MTPEPEGDKPSGGRAVKQKIKEDANIGNEAEKQVKRLSNLKGFTARESFKMKPEGNKIANI